MRTSLIIITVLLASLFMAGSPVFAQAALVEEHWPNGQLRLRKNVLRQEDGTIVDHGRFERWHDNGNSEYEAVFVLGRKEGTTVRYHRNGQMATRQEYRNGQRHGGSISWDGTGVKVKEENWAEGEPHGTWTIWQDGKVKWSNTFNHGKPATAQPEKPVSD